MTDYDLCSWCDGTGDDGDWHCRMCKGEGVAEVWRMDAESRVIGLSDCFRSADDWYDWLEGDSDELPDYDSKAGA